MLGSNASTVSVSRRTQPHAMHTVSVTVTTSLHRVRVHAVRALTVARRVADSDVFPVSFFSKYFLRRRVVLTGIHKWRLAQSPSCDCGHRQTMNLIVNTYPLTKFEGGLNLLHKADDGTIIWLESTVTAALTGVLVRINRTQQQQQNNTSLSLNRSPIVVRSSLNRSSLITPETHTSVSWLQTIKQLMQVTEAF